MSFDGYYMHHMNIELKQKLQSGRIVKIQQPNAFELLLTVRAHQKNYKLLYNIGANNARYHITQEQFVNPEAPTNFCMVLRKYVEGAVLLDVQQIGLDRITNFIFKCTNDIGDTQVLHLTVELMGKHSNICLVQPETNKMIDCMKHVPLSKNTYRILLPNAMYLLPPTQNKKNIFELTVHDYKQYAKNELTIETIPKYFQGFSKNTVELLKHYQQKQGYSTKQVIHVLKNTPSCAITTSKHFCSIAILDGTTFSTLSESLDEFYRIKAQQERVRGIYHGIFQKLTAIILKNTQKIKNIEQDLRLAKNAQEFKIKGDILTANAYAINKGQSTVTLADFYNNDQPITISLKPNKTVIQNANDYFKKYQKLKQSTTILTQQKALAKSENDYLESVLVQLDHATLVDMNAIKQELISTGYIKSKSNVKKNKQEKTLDPIHYQSSDGTVILVGRNNLQNDQLTLRLAHKTDIWLHTKDIPGSHVIIKCENPTEQTLHEAAMIAAYHSKFKQSANVPVDYVAVSLVKKPNGAKPGFVIYQGQKTIYVTPNEKDILKMKQ